MVTLLIITTKIDFSKCFREVLILRLFENKVVSGIYESGHILKRSAKETARQNLINYY